MPSRHVVIVGLIVVYISVFGYVAHAWRIRPAPVARPIKLRALQSIGGGSVIHPWKQRVETHVKHGMSKDELLSIAEAVLASGTGREFRLSASVMSKPVLSHGNTLRMDHNNWNELLECAVSHDLVELCSRIWFRMVELRMAPVGHVLLKYLSKLSERHKFDEAHQVLLSAKDLGVSLTLHHYLAVLRCSGTYPRIQAILLAMERARLPVNVMTYTTAIKSCEATEDYVTALRLLDQMRAVGIAPNEITYCCAISVAARAKRSDIPVSLLREMNRYLGSNTTSSTPSSNSDATIVTTALDIGAQEELKSTVGGIHVDMDSEQELTDRSEASTTTTPTHNQPNQLCYGGVLTACAKAGEWMQVDALLSELAERGALIEDTIFVGILVGYRSQLHLQTGVDTQRRDRSNRGSNGSGGGGGIGRIRGKVNSQREAIVHISPQPQTEKLPRIKALLDKWLSHISCTSDRLFSHAMDICEQQHLYHDALHIFRDRTRLLPQIPCSRSVLHLAMRACVSIANADAAMSVLSHAQMSNSTTTQLILSTLGLLEDAGRHRDAVAVLSGLALQAPSGVDVLSQMRVSLLTIARVCNNALRELTQGFMAGREKAPVPSPSVERLISSASPVEGRSTSSTVNTATGGQTGRNDAAHLAVLLRVIVGHGELLEAHCYPMACKVLLDRGDHATLRLLLNQTLSAPNKPDSSKLYDFTVRSLLQPPRQQPETENETEADSHAAAALGVVLLMMGDLIAANATDTAMAVFLLGVESVVAAVENCHRVASTAVSAGDITLQTSSTRPRCVVEPGALNLMTAALRASHPDNTVRSQHPQLREQIARLRALGRRFESFVLRGQRLLGERAVAAATFDAALSVYGATLQSENIKVAYDACMPADGGEVEILRAMEAIRALEGIPNAIQAAVGVYEQAIKELQKITVTEVVNNEDSCAITGGAEDSATQASAACALHRAMLRACATATTAGGSITPLINTILSRMAESRCNISDPALMPVLVAAARQGQRASLLLGRVIADAVALRDEAMVGAIVLAYCSHQQWDTALQVYRRLHPDIIGPIRCASSSNTVDNHQRRKSKDSGSVTCNQLVDVIAAHGDDDIAQQIYFQALQGGVFNSLQGVHKGLVGLEYHSTQTARVAVQVLLQLLVLIWHERSAGDANGASNRAENGSQSCKSQHSVQDVLSKVKLWVASLQGPASKDNGKGEAPGLVLSLGDAQSANTIAGFLASLMMGEEDGSGDVVVQSNRVVISGAALRNWLSSTVPTL